MRHPILALAFSIAPSLAESQCELCDDAVEITEAYAECFRENFDDLIDAFDESGRSFHIVNLGACREGAGGLSSRDFTSMGSLPAPELPKAVYVLDRDGAVCLRRLIDEHDGPFDPITVFRLSQACADGR